MTPEASAATIERVAVGTTVITQWGLALVIRDWWPDDPNYEIQYADAVKGAFTHVTPLDSERGLEMAAFYARHGFRRAR